MTVGMYKVAADGPADELKLCGRSYTCQVQDVLRLESSSLLRAVSYAEVLHGCGRRLAANEGKAEDYALSTPVHQIDHFLSHTWSTPRFKKVRVLMVFYNFFPAMVFWIISQLAVLFLVHRNVLPPDAFKDVSDVVSFVVWPLTFLTWHEISRCCGVQRPRVFLDKLCIHQTDAGLKAKGIEKLPAFLQASRSMVIVYSKTYLTRLWTVYELATYLLLKPDGHVTILPVDMDFLLPSLILAMIILPGAGSTEVGLLGPVLLGFPLLAVGCNWGVEKTRRMCLQIKNFDIRTAECFSESDRPVVQSNVEAFVKHKRHVAADVGQAEALEVFNNFVHEKLPALVKESLGPVGIPYRVASLIYVPGLNEVWQFYGHAACGGQSWYGVHVVGLKLRGCHWLMVSPLVVAAGVYVAKAFLSEHKLQGWSLAKALVATTLVLFFAECALSAPMLALAFLFCDFPAVSMAGFVAYVTLLGLVNHRVYGLHERGCGASYVCPCLADARTESEGGSGQSDESDTDCSSDAASWPGAA